MVINPEHRVHVHPPCQSLLCPPAFSCAGKPWVLDGWLSGCGRLAVTLFWSHIPTLHQNSFVQSRTCWERGGYVGLKSRRKEGKKRWGEKGRSSWGGEIKFPCSTEGEQEHSLGASWKGSLGRQGSACSSQQQWLSSAKRHFRPEQAWVQLLLYNTMSLFSNICPRTFSFLECFFKQASFRFIRQITVFNTCHNSFFSPSPASSSLTDARAQVPFILAQP